MGIYENPLYFDIAFQYRDIGKECDFAESVLELFSKTENRRVLDVYCGTGRHLFEFSRRGYKTDGLDTSETMLEFIREHDEYSKYNPNLWQSEIENFDTDKEYGLLTNMLTSFNYIITNEDVLTHLNSAAKALSHGGLYFIELNHPRDLLGPMTSATNEWVEIRDDIQVEVDWNYKNAPLDYLSQTYTVDGTLKVQEEGKEKTLVTKEKIRIFLYQEIKALIKLSGWFSIVGSYGAFNLDQKLDTGDNSWRMILILRKE